MASIGLDGARDGEVEADEAVASGVVRGLGSRPNKVCTLVVSF